MRNLKTARQLSLSYRSFDLTTGRNGGHWYCQDGGTLARVEEAVFSYFQNEGWRGYAGEGGLILNLIKAASFESISPRHRATFVEALYASNVSFVEDKFEKSFLLKNVKNATLAQVRSNWAVMTDRKTYISKSTFLPRQVGGVNVGGRSGEFPSSRCVLDIFPDLEESHVLDLFESLGSEKLFAIAQRFASNPYEYRRGWPDLTLWKDGKVKFVEVKGPGDEIRNSQRKVIVDILKPLDFDVTIADVTARQSSV